MLSSCISSWLSPTFVFHLTNERGQASQIFSYPWTTSPGGMNYTYSLRPRPVPPAFFPDLNSTHRTSGPTAICSHHHALINTASIRTVCRTQLTCDVPSLAITPVHCPAPSASNSSPMTFRVLSKPPISSGLTAPTPLPTVHRINNITKIITDECSNFLPLSK